MAVGEEGRKLTGTSYNAISRGILRITYAAELSGQSV